MGKQLYLKNVYILQVQEMARQTENSEDLNVSQVSESIQKVLLNSAELTFPFKTNYNTRAAFSEKKLPGYNLDSRQLKQEYYRAKSTYKRDKTKANSDNIIAGSKAHKTQKRNRLKRNKAETSPKK